MCFRMAVRAKQDALGHFRLDFAFTPVRERAKVQLKLLGGGIDMVPVSGITFPEEIAALACDIASLSLALRKPLGVRVLPIPNRAANEFTEFNLDFLCDSRVVGLQTHDRSIATADAIFSFVAPRIPPYSN